MTYFDLRGGQAVARALRIRSVGRRERLEACGGQRDSLVGALPRSAVVQIPVAVLLVSADPNRCLGTGREALPDYVDQRSYLVVPSWAAYHNRSLQEKAESQ